MNQASYKDATDIKFATCDSICPGDCEDAENWKYYSTEKDEYIIDETITIKCEPSKIQDLMIIEKYHFPKYIRKLQHILLIVIFAQ